MNGLDEGLIELVKMSLRATLLIGILMGLRLILRRHVSAGIIFGMWLVLAGVLLIPLRVPVPWSRLAWVMPTHSPKASPLVTARTPGGALERSKGTTAGTVQRASRLPSPPPEVLAAIRKRTINFHVLGVSISTERSYVRTLLLIWAIGVVVLVGMRRLTLEKFYRKLARTTRESDPRLQRLVEEGGARWRMKRVPEVVTTSLVAGPALSGLFRPRLLVPPAFAQKLSDEELHWVVAHELAHLRRRDLWAQALLQAACVVHWFNPLVWLAARLARRDCEPACDEFVLRHAMPEERENYGCALLKVMGLVSGRSRVPAALGIFANKQQLRRRIGKIADHRVWSWPRSVLGVLLLGAFVVVGYTREVSANAARETHSAPQAPAAARAGEFHPIIMPVQSPEVIAQRKAREKARQEWESKVKFELRAVGTIGGVPVAIIDMDEQPQAATAGSHLLRWSVDRIDPLNKSAVLTKSGEPARELFLTNPSDVRFVELDEARKDLLIKNSIRRIRQYPLIPHEVEGAWERMSRDAKEAILVNFMNSGIIMTRVFEPSGNGGGSTSLLFSKQISEMSRKDMAMFLDSLSPEQREKYHGGGMLAVKFTDPPAEQQKQRDRAEAAAKDQADVIAELTTEQRKLYDAWQTWSGEVSPAKRL